MALTPGGTPYVESSDLVADYPTVSLALAEHIDDLPQTILQVVTTIKSDRFTTTSGTPVDITGYSATITPSSATSKILVMSSFHFSDSDTASYPKFKLLRDSTDLGLGDASGSGTRVTAGVIPNSHGVIVVHNIGYNILDSPATTSATTYKWQVSTFSSRLMTFNGAQTTPTANSLNTSSTIILMEVAA
jgi:hypothetical protein